MDYYVLGAILEAYRSQAPFKTQVNHRTQTSVAGDLGQAACHRNQRKKRSERLKHCTLAVVTRNQNFSPRRRPPSRGRRTAKIQSAGDGQYLHLQIQFGENRCTQFRVIMVTDVARPRARCKPTYRTDNNTLRRYAYSAQCNQQGC